MFKKLTLILGFVCAVELLALILCVRKSRADDRYIYTKQKIYDSLENRFKQSEKIHLEEREYQEKRQKEDSVHILNLKQLKKRDSLLAIKANKQSYNNKTGKQLIYLLDSAYEANRRGISN